MTMIHQRRTHVNAVVYTVKDQQREIGHTEDRDRALLWDQPWKIRVKNGIVQAQRRSSTARSVFVNRSSNG